MAKDARCTLIEKPSVDLVQLIQKWLFQSRTNRLIIVKNTAKNITASSLQYAATLINIPPGNLCCHAQGLRTKPLPCNRLGCPFLAPASQAPGVKELRIKPSEKYDMKPDL